MLTLQWNVYKLMPPQRNCGERWLVFLFIALLEEIGGATTAPEFVPDGVVGTEILIAVETGYLMKRSH